jgi:hypothetical protein
MAADWFVAFWPVGLIVLAIAGVGVAIYLLRDKFVEVFDWLKNNWVLVGAILLGPFAVAALEIKRHWDDIKGWASDAVNWIRNVWGDLEHILEAPFKAATDFIMRIWNDTVGQLKMPNLPGSGVVGGALHAIGLQTGGIVTSPTLALIGENGPEAVVPLSGPHRPGATVHIQNATFNSAVDADLIAKRIEFATSAGLAY